MKKLLLALSVLGFAVAPALAQTTTTQPEFASVDTNGDGQVSLPFGDTDGDGTPDEAAAALYELALDFLTWYQALGQALVRAGFTRASRTPATGQPDWESFALHIEERFDPDSDGAVQGAVAYLSWSPANRALRELERRMQAASDRQDFEEAARQRNRLFAVRHLAERQAADKRAIGTVDVIGIAASNGTAAVQVFPLRGGRLTDRHSFFLENIGRSYAD